MRLIDADALAETLGIKAKCDDCQYQNGSFYKRGGEFVDACEAIYDAPTIEERKRGRWAWSEADVSWCCGACGCVFEEIEWKPEYNYCPNCGADMRGDT